MAENWANALNGAHIVDVSSEIEGCLAENALNNQLNSIWLTEEGLPQWICISLAKVTLNNNNNNNNNHSSSSSSNINSNKQDNQENENVIIRTVGWYCWHEYQTNPKVVTIHVSADGSKFKPWDTFTASMSSKEAQLFCCAPISTNIYPYLAIEVTETFGGNQTYMNEIFLYSEEMIAAPTLNNNSHKNDINNNNNVMDDLKINTPPPTSSLTDMNASINTMQTHNTHHTTETVDTQVLIGRLEDALGIDPNTRGMDASITSELSMQSPHPVNDNGAKEGTTETETDVGSVEDDLMSLPPGTLEQRLATSDLPAIVRDNTGTTQPITSTGDSTSTTTTTTTSVVHRNNEINNEVDGNGNGENLNESVESGKVFFGARSQTGTVSKINPSSIVTDTPTNTTTDNGVGPMSIQDIHVQPPPPRTETASITNSISTSNTTPTEVDVVGKSKSKSKNNDVIVRVQRLESVVNKLAGAIQRLDMGIIDGDNENENNDCDDSYGGHEDTTTNENNVDEYHHSDYIAGHLIETDLKQEQQQHYQQQAQHSSKYKGANKKSINLNYTHTTIDDDGDEDNASKQWPSDRDPPDLHIDVEKFKEGVDIELDQAVQRVRAIMKQTRKVKQVVQSSVYDSTNSSRSKSRGHAKDSDLNFDTDFHDDIYDNDNDYNKNFTTGKYGYGVDGYDDDGYRGCYDRSRSKRAWSPKSKYSIKPKVDTWWGRSCNNLIFDKYKRGRKVMIRRNNRKGNGNLNDVGTRKSISTANATTTTTTNRHSNNNNNNNIANTAGRSRSVTFSNNYNKKHVGNANGSENGNSNVGRSRSRSRNRNTVPPFLRRYAVDTEDGVYLYAGDYRPPPRTEIKVLHPPIRKKSTTVQVQTQPEIDVNEVREAVDRMMFAAFNSNSSNYINTSILNSKNSNLAGFDIDSLDGKNNASIVHALKTNVSVGRNGRDERDEKETNDINMKAMIRTLHDKVTRQMHLEAALKRVKLKKQYCM